MSELRADTITASDGTSPVTLTKQHAAKATARADSAASLLDSNGISSGADNGAGNYTFNLTNAMSDSDFVVCATASAGGSKNVVFLAQSASSFDIETFTTNTAANADSQHAFAVHGDLA
jgi:hypothetical protein